MSGIFGIFKIDHGTVIQRELDLISSRLSARGPDRTTFWREDSVGFGFTLLATTPELEFEHQPLCHAQTGCRIVADVRLDNREELIAALGLQTSRPLVGDAELLLSAYLAWGEDCVSHLLGDFAFAIWDPRQQKLFGARDHLGMRPFLYHYSPERLFVFASEASAIHALPQIPFQINEGRIADALVGSLEGLDMTSTFHKWIFRLPPAHTIAVTHEGLRCRHYWSPQPGPELRLQSQEGYNEAFLNVFTEAVRCRLRSAGPVGSMLSGGMDSGTVVAVARGLLDQQNRGPLQTFSCVGPEPSTCVETRAIHAAITMKGQQPHLIRHDSLERLMPQLEELSWNLGEPFDYTMTLPRALYIAAHQQGIKVMLDGAAGDVVLSEGRYLPRLLLRGRWLRAYRETRGQEVFWGKAYPAWHELYLAARAAVGIAMPRLQRFRQSRRAARCLDQEVLETIRNSLIDPEFAKRVDLAQRIKALNAHSSIRPITSYRGECAQAISHPYLTVGRERYDRVASAQGIEPRDPFMDRRVVEFCLALPAEQKQADGWPKIILRRAMQGLMPDAVRWRTGKEHLGWAFTQALLAIQHRPAAPSVAVNWDVLAPYLSAEGMRLRHQPNLTDNAKTLNLEHLATWLSSHQVS